MTRPLLFALLVAGVVHSPAAEAATCESLAALPLQNAHVTSAQMVAAGAFTPPAAPARGGGAAAARGGAPGAAAEGRGNAAAGRGAAGRGGRGPAPNPYAML